MRFSLAAGDTVALGFLVPPGAAKHSLSENRPIQGAYPDQPDQAPLELGLAVRGLYSDQDGDLFSEMVKQLEVYASSCIPEDSDLTGPLSANSLFLLFHRNGGIDTWVNELPFRSKVRAKRGVKPGPANVNDIADIENVDLSSIDIPEDSGFAAYLSLPDTTNKCVVFDLRRLDPEWKGRQWDPSALLSAALTHLIFRAQVSLTDDDWNSLSEQRWFPFVCLDIETIHLMIATIRNGAQIDDVLPDIASNVRALIPEIRSFISQHTVYARHRKLLIDALSAYERGEYALVATVLFARIEGIIREYYARTEGAIGWRDQQKKLLSAVAKRATRNPLSLLEPKRFAQYLERVIYTSESFDAPDTVALPTRHSTAHGVIDATMLDDKVATIALLCLYQSGIMVIDSEKES